MLKKFYNTETADVIETLQTVFDELDINAYLIGAQARDIWFLPKKLSRITQDIDWIVANSAENVFNELKEKLLKKGFLATNNPIKFLSPDGTEVDLIPFDYKEMPHLIGVYEIFERGTQTITFENGKSYNVATIPAIVMLKLIAWDDRPEYRAKDVDDISTIIQYYFDLDSDDIFNNHNDLFGEKELNQIGARVIGRKIARIIGKNDVLKNKIISILKHNTALSNPKMAQIMVNQTEMSITESIALLTEILNGILEK